MKKILIVDDDPVVVALAKSRLEAKNFQVILAADGDEGITKAQSENPDLIVMDIMMPKMDGGQAVRILKSNHATRDIPIIFLTSIISKYPQGQEAQGINVDGVNYPTLAKPFDPAVLISEINRWL